MIKTTIIIPCYNEAERLPVEAFQDFVTGKHDISFLFVNDGSTDNTSEIIDQLSLRFPKNIEVLALPKNVGKGEAVRAGFNYAFSRDASQVLFCDADFAVGPSDLLRICNALDEKIDCKAVIGSRIALSGSNIQRSTFRHYSGRAFATLVSLTLGHQIYDTQCGAKVFTVDDEVRRAFSQPFLSRWAFDVEVIGRLLRMGQPRDSQKLILELPLLSWVEVPGSKITLIWQLRTVVELLKIRTSLRTWS